MRNWLRPIIWGTRDRSPARALPTAWSISRGFAHRSDCTIAGDSGISHSGAMKAAFLCLSAMALAGDSGSASSVEAIVMDTIEAQIVLPVQAKPLDAYARYYARGSDGSVIGTYVLPHVYRAELDACRGSDCQQAPVIRAGERRWLADWSILPTVGARSCSLVVVVYDPAKRQIEELRCTEGLS